MSSFTCLGLTGSCFVALFVLLTACAEGEDANLGPASGSGGAAGSAGGSPQAGTGGQAEGGEAGEGASAGEAGQGGETGGSGGSPKGGSGGTDAGTGGSDPIDAGDGGDEAGVWCDGKFCPDWVCEKTELGISLDVFSCCESETQCGAVNAKDGNVCVPVELLEKLLTLTCTPKG